jgi:GNAT superfamily N-acetyltransferase
MKERSKTPKLKVTEVTEDRWNDFEKLFSARGSPRYCWCMAWRADQKDPRSGSGSGRKILMKQRISEGGPVGLLGYIGEEPVAWCSLAPFDTFRGLRKPGEAEETEKLWSITCFFVRRQHRGIGLAKQLLAAAVRHAREHGASLAEGYAVEPDSPSYRHMGFVSMFKEAGFTEVAREGKRRHVMQLPMRRSRK